MNDDFNVKNNENIPTSVQIIEDYENSIRFENIRNQVKYCIESVQDNFMRLGYLFDIIVKNKYYEQLGFNNFEEYIKEEYSFSRTTANKLIAIYRKFGKEINDDYRRIEVKDEYKDYNMSQLVELISVSEDEIKTFEPQMTIKEMRENKTALKAQKLLDDMLDSSSPRSALSIFINNICESKSYKYPDESDPVMLSLLSIRKIKSNNLLYELKFKLSLNFFNKKISAVVYSSGDIYFNDLYLRIEINDYLEGLKPNIKKQITEKINDLISDYNNDLKEENKRKDQLAELKLRKLEFFGKYHNVDILCKRKKYEDMFNPYNYKYIFTGLYTLCKKNNIDKIKFNDENSIQLGEGQVFDYINNKEEKIEGLNYKSIITVNCNYSIEFSCKIFDNERELINYKVQLIELFNLILVYGSDWFERLSLIAIGKIPSNLLSIEHQEFSINKLDNEYFDEDGDIDE